MTAARRLRSLTTSPPSSYSRAAASACSATLEQQIPECSHAPAIARLRCFRGIDTLTAAGLCAEVGSFHRFPQPALLSGFLGIVPSERTSDLKRRQGAITKAGSRTRPPAARRSRPPLPPPACDRRDARSPPSRPRPARDRDRLARAASSVPALAAPARPSGRKPAGVVAIAVARELAGFLWEAATLDA